MAEPEQDGTPRMSQEEVEEYKIELANELHGLEFAQALHWSQYKADRIKRLKQRLGIDTEE